MNIKTDDNHITALLDTRDGKAYRDNAFNAFGSCLEQHLMDTINAKVEKMLPGMHEMKLGNELHEAFAIVSSFLEQGRLDDVKNSEGDVSQEALRCTAMFVAASFYMQAMDFRLFKEAFNETFDKFGIGLGSTDRMVGYLVYLQENVGNIKKRQSMCQNVMQGLSSVINDVLVHKGMRDVSEQQ